MPVTHGVAGSSPVQTAHFFCKNQESLLKFNFDRFFLCFWSSKCSKSLKIEKRLSVRLLIFKKTHWSAHNWFWVNLLKRFTSCVFCVAIRHLFNQNFLPNDREELRIVIFFKTIQTSESRYVFLGIIVNGKFREFARSTLTR